MTRSPDRVFELLPTVHRLRDTERGDPLRALLQVVAEQLDVIEDDLDRMYDNWFVETCEEWVVPYIGDLIGYEPVHEAGQPGDVTTPAGRALNRILIPRREVANTIRYRRRKGTLAVLELLAHDVAGWPARAVERYRHLVWTQPLNHQRRDRGRSADLRDGDALARVDGPFDTLARTPDVRSIASRRTRGRGNIPDVALFVWRLRAYLVDGAPAYCLEQVGSHCYTFSVLGNDTPLFTAPTPEPSPEHIAGPANVPHPISRRALERDLELYYGAARSIEILVADDREQGPARLVPPDEIIVADLSDWQQYVTPRDHVAVDPELGRLMFPPRQSPRAGVWVRYRYGFSDDTGGGVYTRSLAQPDGATVYQVGHGEAFQRITDALATWREDAPRDAVIEITDAGVYTEQITIDLPDGHTLQLRAADGARPVLRLMDWHTARPDALWIRGGTDARVVLDGLLVTGRGVQIEGPLTSVTIRHCTLVPGWTIDADCEPLRPAEPSLALVDTTACVTIERTILGSIQVSADEVTTDPLTLRIVDSILDATGSDREAVGAAAWRRAHAALTVERSTVIGRVEVHAIDLASNSIFVGHIDVARRQRGCMRFSYVTPGSRTPKRYRCQPDASEREARAAVPTEDVGPLAEATIAVGADPTDAPDQCRTVPGMATLEVAVNVDDTTPAIDDEVTLTVTVDNNGPWDAGDVEVTLTGPTPGCFDALALWTSHGSFDEPTGVWTVGDLPAGGRAALTALLQVTGPCAAQEVLRATVSDHRMTSDGVIFMDEVVRGVRERVQPRFTSIRYGTPGYGQLAQHCPDEIARGADDESEMGAFHDLFQPQRATNLQARLDEFTPAGMTSATVYAT